MSVLEVDCKDLVLIVLCLDNASFLEGAFEQSGWVRWLIRSYSEFVRCHGHNLGISIQDYLEISTDTG